MRATTGFPSMETLYICIYSSTMASTALHPNLFIPAFAEICVNIAFVATFMNEYISYFESFSLIKKGFPNLYDFPSKEITNQHIHALAFSPFGLLSVLLKTSPHLYSGNISINLLMSCKNLAPSGNIPAPSYFLIYVTDSS